MRCNLLLKTEHIGPYEERYSAAYFYGRILLVKYLFIRSIVYIIHLGRNYERQTQWFRSRVVSVKMRMLKPEQSSVLISGKFGVFEWKVLRPAYGEMLQEDDSWKRRMNYKLHQLLGGPPFVHPAKVGLGILCGCRPVKMVLANDPTETRRRDWQRTRWLYQVEADSRGLCTRWRSAAMDHLVHFSSYSKENDVLDLYGK